MKRATVIAATVLAAALSGCGGSSQPCMTNFFGAKMCGQQAVTFCTGGERQGIVGPGSYYYEPCQQILKKTK